MVAQGGCDWCTAAHKCTSNVADTCKNDILVSNAAVSKSSNNHLGVGRIKIKSKNFVIVLFLLIDAFLVRFTRVLVMRLTFYFERSQC